MFVIIDGAEKVGKTTTISRITKKLLMGGWGVFTRKWGPVDPDDRVYLPPLVDATNGCGLYDWVIWDRSWASEHVYAKLLNRNRRLKDDPWLGEWLYGRAVQTHGIRVMLTTRFPDVLESRRDNTDLPVSPWDEEREFEEYADRFGWTKINVDGVEPDAVAESILYAALSNDTPINAELTVPHYCGPRDAPVVFVGEVRNERAKVVVPGAWLPFTSRMTMEFGREFGDDALRCGWTNMFDCPPNAVRTAKLIVSCGNRANLWVDKYVLTPQSTVDHINFAHPSWLYRFNTAKTREARGKIKQLVEAVRYYVKENENEEERLDRTG